MIGPNFWQICLAAASILSLSIPSSAAATEQREFELRSRDGSIVTGVAGLPIPRPARVVIMVPGTGFFDRDMRFGNSRTERDMVFRDLARRLEAAGVATVRYDRRGMSAGRAPDLDAARSITNETLRDDLGTVYAWTRSRQGLNARCVLFLGHSEGMRHITALARSGAPAPAAVVGIGAPMRSPMRIMRWQLAERGIHILRLLDLNGDGQVSRAEASSHWRNTPAIGLPAFAASMTNRDLSQGDIEAIRASQEALYARERRHALGMVSAEPFRVGGRPYAHASWWQSWFLDDVPIARGLSTWGAPVALHYGALDSQLDPLLEVETANDILGPIVRSEVHPAVGHTLGADGVVGPIQTAIADRLIAQIAAADCPR